MSSMINRIANYQQSLSTKTNRFKSMVGVVQMHSGPNLQENYLKVEKRVRECAERGAQMVCLPENFAYQNDKSLKIYHEDVSEGEYFQKYRMLALENRVWLSMGSFPETCRKNPERFYQTHFIINHEGNIVAQYRKMHRFDVDFQNKSGDKISESEYLMAGDDVTTPCFSPVGYLGLSISYDLRFPELYRHLVLKGAQVLLVPSAFLASTGATHWETLLRARAIEN
jgi:deaminated glutathione amidase